MDRLCIQREYFKECKRKIKTTTIKTPKLEYLSHIMRNNLRYELENIVVEKYLRLICNHIKLIILFIIRKRSNIVYDFQYPKRIVTRKRNCKRSENIQFLCRFHVTIHQLLCDLTFNLFVSDIIYSP